jgi:hypothetical protein
MTLHKPFGHASGYLDTVQNILNAQRRLIQYLRSTADSLLSNCFTRLVEQKSEGGNEDDSGKHDDPQTDAN